MAWTLYGFDPSDAIVPAAKAVAGALGGVFLKVMWRAVMGYETAADKCMITGCSGFVANNRRGLCNNCYKRAKAKVDSGETTWGILAERGLCVGKADPFDDAYSRAMEDM